MSRSFEFDAPELFTAGTVGPPGQRDFYLQARQGELLATLKAEKEQVRALAEYLGRLLAERPASPEEGDFALREPATPAWIVGSIGVGYDREADRIVIEVEELVENEEEAEGTEGAQGTAADDPGAARVRLTRAQAAAFVQRAVTLIRAGRPACPICGRPIDPGGHVCPRSNGRTRD
jgi:uncharacterized repeat protein (TIGR03847 family)